MFLRIAVYLLAINLVTIFLYWWDKRQAVWRESRVPEMVLLLVGFIGGTPGAIFAQHTFRHKTRKQPFKMVFWILTAIQIYLVCFVIPAKLMEVY